MKLGSNAIADCAGFELLGSDLGKDVERVLQTALSKGVVFAHGFDPLTIFRQELTQSIRSIESHPKGRLIQDFLLKGPFETSSKLPNLKTSHCLSDAECASATAFIFFHMVNSFKAAIAELLAVRPCLKLLTRLQKNGQLPKKSRLYVGDSVASHAMRGKGLRKGADLYILTEHHHLDAPEMVNVAGVAEVKSYLLSASRLQRQLNQHLLRAGLGLRVRDRGYSSERITVGIEGNGRAVRISVLPSSWKLSREFWFEEAEHGRVLRIKATEPPQIDDSIMQTAEDDWRITLRWSMESLAEAAYVMTFWYMEKVGETVFAKSVPKGWERMSAAEAGKNAAKESLYHAIFRCRGKRDEQRAIALYNSYCYGYALGMNFKNEKGRREMLWPQHLDELLNTGKTKDRCRVTL